MYDVANSSTGAAHRKFKAAARKLAAFKVLYERFHFVFTVHQKFDVITGGEPQVAVTMFFGNFSDFTDVGGAHKPGTADPYRENLVA